MTQHHTQGAMELSASPEKEARYEMYRQLNAEPEGSGNPTEDAQVEVGQVDVKVEPEAVRTEELGSSEADTSTGDVSDSSTNKAKQESAKPEKQGMPPKAQKAFDKRTAQLRTAQEKLEVAKAKLAKYEEAEKASSSVDEQSFVSNKELVDHQVKTGLNSALKEAAEADATAASEEVVQLSNEAFKADWNVKVGIHFDTPEKLNGYRARLQSRGAVLNTMGEDVREFMETSDVGPLIADAFLQQPQYVAQINALPTLRKGKVMQELEHALSQAPQVSTGTQFQAVPVAADPVGEVNTTGGKTTTNRSSAQQVADAMKAKNS